jgi:type VI secretion system secreted protein Hcp
MAADFFLEIITKRGGKIKGESLSAACTGQIEVDKFSLGITSQTQFDPDASGPAKGRIQLEEAEFEFETSIATTPIFQTLCTNDVIKQATLTCRRSGAGTGKEATFLQWRFNDARLISYKASGQQDDIVDTIRIAYAGIEVLYKQQKEDGSLSANMMASYDAGENAMTTPTLGKK